MRDLDRKRTSIYLKKKRNHSEKERAEKMLNIKMFGTFRPDVRKGEYTFYIFCGKKLSTRGEGKKEVPRVVQHYGMGEVRKPRGEGSSQPSLSNKIRAHYLGIESENIVARTQTDSRDQRGEARSL